MSYKSNVPTDEEIEKQIQKLEFELRFCKALLQLNELGRAEALLEVAKLSRMAQYRTTTGGKL
jgi:hypothetical protein